jgi:hypothetical protein
VGFVRQRCAATASHLAAWQHSTPYITPLSAMTSMVARPGCPKQHPINARVGAISVLPQNDRARSAPTLSQRWVTLTTGTSSRAFAVFHPALLLLQASELCSSGKQLAQCKSMLHDIYDEQTFTLHSLWGSEWHPRYNTLSLYE